MRNKKRQLAIGFTAFAMCAMLVGLLALHTAGRAHANTGPCVGAPDSLQCLKQPDDDDRQPISEVGDPASNVSNATGSHGDGHRASNVFVNDPCLDPSPLATVPDANEPRRRTVQSETTIGVLHQGGSKQMVAGYNDSFGFYNNRQGLSGYAYSLDGGAHWVDGGGLPPTSTTDLYEGDPVIVVHQESQAFYFASIYRTPDGKNALSVNRGQFKVAPPTGTESHSNTRCLNHPELNGTPDTTNLPSERIVWDAPSVPVTSAGDFFDKEWLFVSQKTGELYLTYTRFAADGATPLELVRSKDGGHTWTAPSTVVPNLADTFNQATQPIVTPSGRVVVSYIARTFSAGGAGPESENRIEEAYSDDDGATFGGRIVVARVNPQGEPPGYNRGRRSILNAPFISFTGKGEDDEGDEGGSASIYITYFSGRTALVNPDGTINTGPLARAGDILLSRSTDTGATWGAPVKVSDDAGTTSHVFPSVQAGGDGKVFVAWLDRRNDPANELTNEWADVSLNGGVSFGADKLQSDVATTWRVRADARPNFGDYNSSVLLNGDKLALVWADGRFTPVAGTPATPDTIFSVATGFDD